MSRPAAPSMPTEKQIREVSEVMAKLNPEAKIHRIGPDGVTFVYGEEFSFQAWSNEPFSAEVKHD